MNAVKNFFSFFIAISGSFWMAQSVTSSSYQPLESVDGAQLYKWQLPDGNEAYLQAIDLRKMQIDQLVGAVDNVGLGQGKYYKGEGGYDSPFFKRKRFEEVTAEYKKLYGNDVFSIINCAFFEQYKSSTQLSFPIKLNGQVITGGSSPYGPIHQPKHPFYRSIQLKALIWDDKQAYITDYDPATGAPLNKTDVQNAIVTYQYNHHPAKAIGNDRGNRYHLIGTLNSDGIKGDELLLIMTVNKAKLDKAADLLSELGVKGDILTIDGGTSTYLFNSRRGNVMLPQSANPQGSLVVRDLPHYLGFRKRG